MRKHTRLTLSFHDINCGEVADSDWKTLCRDPGAPSTARVARATEAIRA